MFFHRPYEIMAHLAGLSVLVLDCILRVKYYDYDDNSTVSTNTSSTSNSTNKYEKENIVSMICEPYPFFKVWYPTDGMAVWQS